MKVPHLRPGSILLDFIVIHLLNDLVVAQFEISRNNILRKIGDFLRASHGRGIV